MTDGSTFLGAQANAGVFFHNLDLDGAFNGGSSADAKIYDKTASYALTPAYSSHIHRVKSATDITVTLPKNAPVGFTCSFVQMLAGKAVFTAASGATLVSHNAYTKTAAQYAFVTIIVIANTDGNSAQYVLIGDGA